MFAKLIEIAIGPKLPVVEGWDERLAVEHDPCEGIANVREMTGVEKWERGYIQ